MRCAVVSVIVLVAGLGGVGYRVHEQKAEEAQALAAKRQIMLALRITSSKLRVVKQKVHNAEDAEKSGHTL